MYKCHPIGRLYKPGDQWLTFTKQLMVTRKEFHNLCNYPHFSITALFIPIFFKACNTFYYDQLIWCLFFSMYLVPKRDAMQVIPVLGSLNDLTVVRSISKGSLTEHVE